MAILRQRGQSLGGCRSGVTISLKGLPLLAKQEGVLVRIQGPVISGVETDRSRGTLLKAVLFSTGGGGRVLR